MRRCKSGRHEFETPLADGRCPECRRESNKRYRDSEKGRRYKSGLDYQTDEYREQHAAHVWLNRHYPRAERCEECGAVGETVYASVTRVGAEGGYSRARDDYAELCSPCHGRLDAGGLVLVGLRTRG